MNNRRLSLKKETLVELTAAELHDVHGAMPSPTYTCTCGATDECIPPLVIPASLVSCWSCIAC